jgi:hypothetical protein
MHSCSLLITTLICTFFAAVSWAQENPRLKKVYQDNCLLGLVDENSKEVLPTEFSTIETTPVGNDYLLTAKNKTQLRYFLYQENKVTPLPYAKVEKLNDRLLKVSKDGIYGAVNTDGKGVLLINYQEIVPAGTTALITVLEDAYGAATIEGQTILPNKYAALKYWSMGGFWGLKDGDYQLYDYKGKKIGATSCDIVRVPTANLPVCGVRKDKKWGLVNLENELVLDFKYKNMLLLDAGLIAVLGTNKKWSLLDLKGKKTTEKSYDLILPSVHAQYIKVVEGNKIGLMNAAGKLVLPVKYQKIDYVGHNWFAVEADGSVKLFHLKTQEFTEQVFQKFLSSVDNKDWKGFLVQEENQWKWFDFERGLQSTFAFKNVSRTSSGVVLVENEKQQLGVFSGQGVLILPMEYQAITPKDDFFRVKKIGLDWYFVNKDNKTVDCVEK